MHVYVDILKTIYNVFYNITTSWRAEVHNIVFIYIVCEDCYSKINIHENL